MRFASIFLLAALSAPGQTSSASIQGTVLDAKTSKPIPVTYVFANRAGAPPVSKHTKSGGDGAFQIQGLIAGTYSLCVEAPNDRFLNPCEWGATPTTVTVTSGQTATVSLKLTAASILNIQVQDAQKLLSGLTADGRRPDLSLAVRGPNGMFYPAHAAGVSLPTPGPTGYRYQLAVPLDTALSFYVASHDLKLGDATGVALPAGASVQAFQHATGDLNPKSFSFSILGLLP